MKPISSPETDRAGMNTLVETEEFTVVTGHFGKPTHLMVRDMRKGYRNSYTQVPIHQPGKDELTGMCPGCGSVNNHSGGTLYCADYVPKSERSVAAAVARAEE